MVGNSLLETFGLTDTTNVRYDIGNLLLISQIVVCINFVFL